MNKKILTLFVVFIVVVSMASVCAVELTKENDFDGQFKMKVAESDNFTKVNNPILKADTFYKNSNGTIFVLVYNMDISASVNEMSKGNLSIINSAVYNDTGVINEGNLFMFNATGNMSKEIGDYKITSFVGVGNDKGTPISVFVGGDNSTLVKEYAKTIVFS